ncbi:MAG: Flp pilus assembly protein CpaB [Alphaproteobacteria bacterium]|nr:Flp pilus assembly protein CpaB [Alphaproteobacteria bacterium]
MNLSKILIIIVALGVAIGAMMFSKSLISQPQQVADVQVVEEIEKTMILLAKTMMPMGHKVSRGDVIWQDWPKDMVHENMITQDNGEDMMQKALASIVKIQIDEGDPIRFSKLIDPKNGGLLSAILAPGMRAISTPISPETGAGGFILPNDKVDILLTKQDKNDQNKTKTILVNIKVLAIDQTIREEDGQQVVVGRTATLELSSAQSEILALANNEGSVTLSLRSLADRNLNENTPTQLKKKLTILRHGKS